MSNKIEKINKTCKERASGLFLLFSAILIAGSLSLNSRIAESKNEQNLAIENQILGEMNNNLEEIVDNSEGVTLDIDEEEKNVIKKEAPEIKTEDKKNRCVELKKLLEKYCGDKYDVKKCRKNLIETKDLSKKDDQCKKLYKKYHFVPKKVEKKDDNADSSANSAVSEIKEEVSLNINYGGSRSGDKYLVAITSGMTVMDMMSEAKKNSGLSYDESAAWPGYIQEINGVREDLSGSVFWMLYYNGEMASEGASTLKVKTGDKIEWRYMAVSW